MDKEQITTPGSIQIKHSLSSKETRDAYDLYTPLNKTSMGKLVNSIITKGGPNAHEDINNLAKTFFNKATDIGATTPLSDYDNDSEDRQAIMHEFSSKVSDILDKDLPKLERTKQLNILGQEYGGKMSKSNLTYMLSKGSTAAHMAATGARGNPMQLSQGTGSPMMALDVKGTPIPVAIKHSYAEGLSPAEHLAASYGGRAATVLAQLSTEKPGALSKKILPALFHEVVTIPDCGTTNGIPLPLSDKHSVIGRFEAGTNHLIDTEYYKELQMSGNSKVIARNPMTCAAKEGLCQKCFGLGPNGQLPHIGQNLGVIAGQSVSEVLTQAMLSTKHQGGVAGQKRNAYEQANTILSNPENFIDQATISEVNGKVNKINQTSLHDWEVTIGDKIHFVPNVQELSVKEGDTLRVGDPISTGVINPRQLVDLKGAGAGRLAIAKSLRDVYSQHASLDPRHFDIIARNMIKHVVVNDPGESGFLPGDKIEVGLVGDYLKRHSKEVPLNSALGATLAESSLDLTPGTNITQNHIDDLAKNGIKTLKVSNSGLKVTAIVPGLQSLKMLDKNWISKLSFNQLHKTIAEAGALGLSSKIHSTEPVASYVMGSEFGEGSSGSPASY
jgi:DNA-directed RNA polymerase subunit beta'